MVGGVTPLLLVWSLLGRAGAQIIPTYYETGPGNLPTDTDISVAVVVDEAWVNTEGLSSGDVDNILRPVLQGYNSGGLEVTDYKQITLQNAANISQEVDFGKINSLHFNSLFTTVPKKVPVFSSHSLTARTPTL